MSSVEDIQRWESYYRSLTESYLVPNEYVLRSFLGQYPRLRQDRDYRDKKICDVSCGDGRNLTLLKQLHFDLYATEISQEICDITRRKLLLNGIDVDIRPGLNADLPFEDDYLDHMLSWNALYYMLDADAKISDHIEEYARVLQPGGRLVASVPGPRCFSLEGARELGDNLIVINTKSKWSLLNGSIYYRFESTKMIEDRFSSHFTNFRFATINDDCFGLPLEYFIFVCDKIG